VWDCSTRRPVTRAEERTRIPTTTDALLRAGVDRDNIHLDKASGAKASRPKLDLVLQLLRQGDTLKVTRLDRLSRSVLHLVTLGADLRKRGIGLHVIEQGIDTDTMEGRAMFGMLSVLAELQRELIVANTMDGLASARARGRVGGRRPRLTADQAALVQELYDARDKTVLAQLTLQHRDLMPQSQDLHLFVAVAHRQQPQRGEGVRHGQVGKSQQHDRASCRSDRQAREGPPASTTEQQPPNRAHPPPPGRTRFSARAAWAPDPDPSRGRD
jgi:DNA invertase Pin-like site-specific DNA recombinase